MKSKYVVGCIAVITVCMMGILCISGTRLSVGSGTEIQNEISGTATEEENLIVVGVSQVGSESLWRTANTASIQGALTKENGYFLIFNNARQKQENQIKAIRGFISQRVDYIVFAPVLEDGWETVLLEAKDAGIPVILVDRKISDADEELYTTWIGTDKEKEGRNAGLWLESYLTKQGRTEEEINIVVLQGTPGSSAQIGRTEGFDAVAAEHSNWNILEQVNAEFTTAKGEEVMAQLIEKYPDIDVVVSQNDDMTFGAIEALKEAGIETGVGKDVTLISFDAVYDALKLVEEGVINVDIECNPLQGEAIADVIQKLESGETIEREYMVEEKIFSQENVGLYLEDRAY